METYTFSTGEDAEKAQNEYVSQTENSKNEKEDRISSERRERFNKIKLGDLATIKEADGSLAEYTVDAKNEKTMEVAIMKDGIGNSRYGVEVDVGKIIDFYTPADPAKANALRENL